MIEGEIISIIDGTRDAVLYMESEIWNEGCSSVRGRGGGELHPCRAMRFRAMRGLSDADGVLA